MPLSRIVLLGLALLGFLSQANAQPIVIAQTAAFTGGPASSVIEMTAGARLVIDAQNALGGINGQRIELVSVDDGFDSGRAAANATDLIAKHNPVALFLTRGTPTAEAMLPILAKNKIPLIGPSTGAMSLRKPVQPYVFNVRSSYQGEAKKAVEQLCGMGFNRIGIIFVDDSFGRDAMSGVNEGFQKCDARPVFVEKFGRDEKDFAGIIKRASDVGPPALLVIAATGPTVAILRGLEASKQGAYVATLSTNASDGFLKSIGEPTPSPLVDEVPKSDGSAFAPALKQTTKSISVIVAQVFPSERATAIPLVREVAALLAASRRAPGIQTALKGPDALVSKLLAGDARLSPSMLEGAASAKVLIAGLKRCVGAPTPAKLITALETGGKIDIGWPAYPIQYSPSEHSGVEYSDLSIASKDAEGVWKFRR